MNNSRSFEPGPHKNEQNRNDYMTRGSHTEIGVLKTLENKDAQIKDTKLEKVKTKKQSEK